MSTITKLNFVSDYNNVLQYRFRHAENHKLKIKFSRRFKILNN